MERKNFYEAVSMFQTRFGKVPLEVGLPAVDADNEQNAYLFARTGGHLKAFRRKEKLFRWLFVWAMPLTAVALAAMLVGLLINPSSMMLLNCIVVGGVGSVVLLILGMMFRKEKNFVNGNVIWLSQPPKPAFV